MEVGTNYNDLKNNLRNAKPVILSFSGASLTDDEREFFNEFNPLGFILFKRNIVSKEQVKTLISDLQDSLPEDRKWVPILIDQEGGQVDRLTNVSENRYPPALNFGIIAEEQGIDVAKQAVFNNSDAIGKLLHELGLNVNCAPVSDLYDDNKRIRTEGQQNPAITDRSFSEDPNTVVELSKSFIDGMKENHILPVVKHIPGHGLTIVDSHKGLPIVYNSLSDLESNDFKVFKELNSTPWAMVSHVIYDALDSKLPASQSKTVVDYIREQIEFKGVLISDALEMEALEGNMGIRTVNVLNSGIDLGLYCRGDLLEMKDIEVSLAQNGISGISDYSIDRIVASLDYFN